MKKLLGLLGWLGVVLVVAAVGLRFAARPEWTWAPQWSQYLAMAGLVVTALYGLSQWRDIGRSFEGRNVRYGSIAFGSVVVFLAILTGVNWIASREHKRWDLTSGGQFQLADQTKQILKDLKKPVHVRVYYDSRPTGEPLQTYKDKFDEYQYYSSEISTDYVDAVREPLKSKQDKIDTLPTIILDYDGRSERTTQADEQSLTNALKKVIEGKPKKVYFVQGHGEHDTADTTARGYSAIADAFKTDNFDVAKLTLAQEGKVPDDATLVVVGGPKVDYLAPEVEALRVYLKKGGKILLMIDPQEKIDAPQPTSLIAFAKEWGVELGNDIVIDTSGMGQLVGANAATPIAMPAPGGHPITRDFELITGFPIARSAKPIEGGANGHTAQAVLQTSPQSWAESDIKELFTTGKPQLSPEKGDVAGPVVLVSAVSAAAPDAPAPASPDLPKPEARLVVVGDSDFLSNGALPIPGNKDLGLNMASWLAQQENLIAIRPKDPENRPLTLTADQKNMVFWLTLVIVPLGLIGNGVRVWWKRR